MELCHHLFALTLCRVPAAALRGVVAVVALVSNFSPRKCSSTAHRNPESQRTKPNPSTNSGELGRKK